jgi:small-conductance mechanosensitive channel
MIQLTQSSEDWLSSIAALAAAALAALVLHWLFFAVADRATRRTVSKIDESIVEHSRSPFRVLAPLAALFLTVPLVPLPDDVRLPLRYAFGLGLVAAAAWVLSALTWIADDLFMEHLGERDAESVEVRATLTQLSILRRVLIAAIVLVAIAIMLLTLPGGAGVGASLLASLGVAGLVFGIAAGPVLSNLLAGVQIALTQPIRLDDVVVIEGEWGRIEEINTTYVVVRIWDLRRLVIPLTTVIQKPFENWTRKTTNLVGTVTIPADYSVDVDDVRAELHRLLESSSLWDGQSWGLQVTEATERTIMLRALVSAADSGALWDLRCLVRERLIGYLKSRQPGSLPRLRTEMDSRAARTGRRPASTV